MGSNSDFVIAIVAVIVANLVLLAMVRGKLVDRILKVPLFSAMEMIIRPAYWISIGIVVVADVLLVVSLVMEAALALR